MNMNPYAYTIHTKVMEMFFLNHNFSAEGVVVGKRPMVKPRYNVCYIILEKINAKLKSENEIDLRYSKLFLVIVIIQPSRTNLFHISPANHSKI